MKHIIISLFLSGLFFGSGPCLASCGPMLICYIAGTKKNILKSLVVYILFSSARIFVYLGLSLVIFFLGSFTMNRLLGSFSKYIFTIGGGFIVITGLLMILDKKLKLFHRLENFIWAEKYRQLLQKNLLEYDKKSIVVFGLLMGLMPCAPLFAILSYVGLISKSWVNSLLYIFSFGIGTFVSPLVLLSILAGSIHFLLKDKQPVYYRIFRIICGIIIIFLGLQLISKVFSA